MNVNNEVILNCCHHAHTLHHRLYVLMSRIHNLYLIYNKYSIYYKIFLGKYDDLLTSLSSLGVKDCVNEVQERIFPFVYLIHIINNFCMQLVETFDKLHMTIKGSNHSYSLYFLFFSRNIIFDSFCCFRDKIKCSASWFHNKTGYTLIHSLHKAFNSIILCTLHRLLYNSSDA